MTSPLFGCAGATFTVTEDGGTNCPREAEDVADSTS
jgi:hypothetical protein